MYFTATKRGGGSKLLVSPSGTSFHSLSLPFSGGSIGTCRVNPSGAGKPSYDVVLSLAAALMPPLTWVLWHFNAGEGQAGSLLLASIFRNGACE